MENLRDTIGSYLIRTDGHTDGKKVTPKDPLRINARDLKTYYLYEITYVCIHNTEYTMNKIHVKHDNHEGVICNEIKAFCFLYSLFSIF